MCVVDNEAWNDTQIGEKEKNSVRNRDGDRELNSFSMKRELNRIE